ncbi:response regulator transcription factor [Aurantibacter crassamenti]|uniref:response regulator transcription factor n=1 Tax=Aurantibacter crassamenti TaxID=1837375 RepID=UPI00193A6566|nr:response regulator transcription factor [Aurantibacter crassamenti]MBM1105850.1 response regulator transcription factor [Aurantibacter crassamenti]
MKILVVEDEPEMKELIKQFLEGENYVVETATNFHSGLDKIVSYDYDCILLDISLPDGNGLDLLQELKNLDKEDSVIIISAKDSIEDKVKGLNLGADDYLIKPFHITELNARIKSVIRRKKSDGRTLLELENVKINIEERLVLINDQPVELNRKEFDILVFFTMNKSRIVSKAAIAENIWGDYIDQANDFDFIYSQIKNLRKKLRAHNAEIDINSVYGMGYKLSLK